MKHRVLNERFEVYIPTKARDNNVEAVLARLTQLARGMTAASVQGGYVTDPGKVLLESVVVYTFYAPAAAKTAYEGSGDKYHEIKRTVADLAHYLIYDKLEESVLVVEDGKPYLFEKD